MKGSDYVAVVRLTTKGDPVPEVLAMPGETCERVPAASLGWLLADGLIAKPDPNAKRPKKARTKGRK